MRNFIKNKLFRFLLAFVIICLPCVILLTACGEKETAPEIFYISAVYKDDTYDFNGGFQKIQYEEGLYFNAEDFKVILKYHDSTEKEITSGFTYKVYKDEQEFDTSQEFGIGLYSLEFQYEEYTGYLTIEIVEILLNEDNVTCSLEKSYPYETDESIEPEFTLTYNGTELVKNTDYTVSYRNNFDTMKGYADVKFIGIYAGEVEYNTIDISYEFDIKTIEAGDINFTDEEVTFNGESQKHSFDDSENPKTVAGVSSITYTYYKQEDTNKETPLNSWVVSDAGVYTVVASFEMERGYTQKAPQEFTFTIKKMDINDVDGFYYGGKYYYFDEDVYNNSSHTNDKVLLSADLSKYATFKNKEYTSDDFDVFFNKENAYMLKADGNYVYNQNFTFDIKKGNGDNLNASTATQKGKFVLTGTGNFTETREVEFEIARRDISDSIYGGIGTGEDETIVGEQYAVFTYNGNPKTFDWVKLSGAENSLIKDVDYTIVYENNTNAGAATYTITGIGNYEGTHEGTFEIDKATIFSDYSEIEEYDFDYPETDVVYDGTDHKDKLLKLNKSLDDRINVYYYNTNTTDENIDLTNAGTRIIDIKFEVKDKKNYNLYGYDTEDNTVYTLREKHVTIAPFIITSDIVFNTTTANFDSVVSGEDGDSYYYTYSKVEKTPDVKITAELTSENTYTLVKGADYTITYFGTESLNAVTPRNAGKYYLKIEYTNQNFAAFFNETSYSYYYTADGPNFNINKMFINSTDVEWPATYRMIKANTAWLDNACSAKSKKTLTETRTINEEQVDNVRFELVTRSDISGSPALINENGKVQITVTTDNYIVESEDYVHELTPEIVNPFTSFKVNGVEKSTTEIEALEELVVGDKVEIQYSGTYSIEYDNNISDYWYTSKIFTSENGVSKFMGVDTKDNSTDLCEETSAYFKVISSGDRFSTYTRLEFKINRDIFTDLKIIEKDLTNSQYVDHINYKNTVSTPYRYFYQLHNYTLNIERQSKLIMNLSQEGYTFDYDVVNWANPETTTTHSDKITSKEWLCDGTIKQVIIRLYNAQNEKFLTLTYNFQQLEPTE